MPACRVISLPGINKRKLANDIYLYDQCIASTSEHKIILLTLREGKKTIDDGCKKYRQASYKKSGFGCRMKLFSSLMRLCIGRNDFLCEYSENCKKKDNG